MNKNLQVLRLFASKREERSALAEKNKERHF
jgi:hypothetical protein